MNYENKLLAQIKSEENNIKKQEQQFFQSKEYFFQHSKNPPLLTLLALVVPGVILLSKLSKTFLPKRSKIKSLAKFIFYTGLKKSLRKFF